MLLSRRTALGSLAILPFTIATGSVANADAMLGIGKRVPAAVGFGTAVRPDQLHAPSTLRSVIARCDIIVPEYHGQWSAVEWRKGEPWFGNYDSIVEFAGLHGQSVRGHSLLWEQMTPEWARTELLETRDWNVVERHFRQLLPRYSGRIGEWVVVNEMIDTSNGSSAMRRNTFQRAFGNEYVDRALQLARELDPRARLMINDYSLCHDNPVDEARRIALLKLVERLKAKGVPLDLVGIQGHIELAKGPIDQKRLARFLSDLADTGVTLAVTEVDVLEDDRSASLSERDSRVAAAFDSLVEVALAEPKVTSITTWGLSDRYSWLQGFADETRRAAAADPVDPTQLNRGLPFDADMQPKLARTALAVQLPTSRFAAYA